YSGPPVPSCLRSRVAGPQSGWWPACSAGRCSMPAAPLGSTARPSRNGNKLGSGTGRRSWAPSAKVSDALTALAKFHDAETGQSTAVRGLEDAVLQGTGRSRQGLASYYEVLEAQQQLYPAQTTLAQIRRNRLTSYVQLYKALGGGWSLTDAEWTA